MNEGVKAARKSIKETPTLLRRHLQTFYDQARRVVIPDIEDSAARERLVVCQAIVAFLAIFVALVVVTIYSLIRLSGNNISLESTTVTYRGTQPLPKVCIEYDSSTLKTLWLYRTIYDQYNGGEDEVEVTSTATTLDVNSGVTVEVECVDQPPGFDANNPILIQGAFEDPIYTFMTVKLFSTADNASVATDGFANLWSQNFPLPYDSGADDWISFHQTFGPWLGVSMEIFYDYSTIQEVNKFSITAGNAAISIFDRSEFRTESPVYNVTENEICKFYMRSSLIWHDITQRQYSVIDAGSSVGGMWSLFLLITSTYFFAFFRARETAPKIQKEVSTYWASQASARSMRSSGSGVGGIGGSTRRSRRQLSKASVSFDAAVASDSDVESPVGVGGPAFAGTAEAGGAKGDESWSLPYAEAKDASRGDEKDGRDDAA